MFTKNLNIKIKRRIDKKKKKKNLYYSCIDCDFKKFETIDKEKLSFLLKSLV